MADTAFTVKVDGKTFTLDRITIGDWRMFKTEFGLNASDIVSSVQNDKNETVEILNLDDPNVLVGLMVAALRHERPLAPMSELIAEVEALSMEGLELPTGEDEDEADPTQVAADDSAATEGRAKSGNSGKRPKKPGTPR